VTICLKGVLCDRLFDIGFLEIFPLLALEGPPLSILEIGEEVDAVLFAPLLTVMMALYDPRLLPNEVAAERFELLPGPVWVMEW
jgi:hypothetical protein